MLLPSRPLSTSGGHYNSIGVFTTIRQVAATTMGATTSFPMGSKQPCFDLLEKPFFCETTSNVTTSGSPPQSTTKPELLDGHSVAQGRQGCRARALHYDYNDNSEREQRILGDDRRTRRLQRQELLSWLYVIVCVTTITTVRRRKRDGLL